MENGLGTMIVIKKTGNPFSFFSLTATSSPEDHREVSYLYKTMVLALDKTWQLKDKITARFILLIELEGTLWSWNPLPLDV